MALPRAWGPIPIPGVLGVWVPYWAGVPESRSNGIQQSFKHINVIFCTHHLGSSTYIFNFLTWPLLRCKRLWSGLIWRGNIGRGWSLHWRGHAPLLQSSGSEVCGEYKVRLSSIPEEGFSGRGWHLQYMDGWGGSYNSLISVITHHLVALSKSYYMQILVVKLDNSYSSYGQSKLPHKPIEIHCCLEKAHKIIVPLQK